jgi:hypothetical protein
VPGSSGYEVSIYAMYPDTFWLIYFIIYLFGFSICIYSIFIKYDNLPFYSSLINLLILNLIILLLPLFRGYFSIDLGDSTNHLAYIVDILSTNGIGAHGAPQVNAYPISHILSAIIIWFTQIKLETLGQIIPVYYYFIFVLFMYLFIKILYKSNEKAILLLLFLFVPTLRSYMYYQSQMFFNLIPILLYAVIKGTTSKNKSISFRYIIVIFIVVFPFMHPASCVLLMILFTIICMAWYCIDPKNFTLTLKGYKNTPFFFIVIWLFWVTSLTYHFGTQIRGYLNWISSLSESYSYYSYYSSGLQEAGLPIIDSIQLYITLFGPMHLLFGMAFVISIYTIYKWAKKKDTDNKLNLILSLIFLVYIILYSVSFFYTIRLLGARIGIYVLLISILINTNYLFDFIQKINIKNLSLKKKALPKKEYPLCTIKKKIISIVLLIILLFSLTYVATFGLYDSPVNKRPPHHVTYMNIYSINWLLQTRNDDLSIEELGYWQGWVVNTLLGSKKASLESNLKVSAQSPVIPHHFNYTNECLLAISFEEDCYLFINKRSELKSVNIFPEYEDRWAFHPDDYKQLEYDRSIDKIYHNNGIRIFYVNGRRWDDI